MSRDYKTHPMTEDEYRRGSATHLRETLAVIQHARRMRNRKGCHGVAWDTYWAAEYHSKESARIALQGAGGLLGEW